MIMSFWMERTLGTWTLLRFCSSIAYLKWEGTLILMITTGPSKNLAL